MMNDPQERLRRLLEQKGIRAGGAAAEPSPRPAGETAPLSFAQERLWFLQRLDPRSPAYNLGQSFDLRGPLDADAMAAALDALVSRHGSLRTGFAADGQGRPVSRLAEARAGILAVEDISELPDEERERAAGAREDLVLAEPFDLSSPPLLRALLLAISPGRHRLVICVHHLVFDGWSIAILARELAALYPAFAQGRPSPLAPLALGYGDYAAWQRRRAAEPAWAADLEWWAEKLSDLPHLGIPADRPRPEQLSGGGAGVSFQIPAGPAESLREIARREGTTLFAVLLAAYESLLGRHSGQLDFGVGVSVAGRTHRVLEDIVGMFVNTVVFRADLSGRLTFLDLVRRVKEEAIGALSRAETPFERVVERLRPERDLSRNPLFQAGFVLQNTPAAEFRLGPVSMEAREPEIRTAKFDLLVSMREEEAGGLAGTAEFSTDLFDPETVSRICARFATLLGSAASTPGEALEDLAWLTPQDLDELERWARPEVRDFSEIAHVHELAGRQPEDRVALVGPDGAEVTYARFCGEAERLARALRARGVGPETLVGVCLERSAELVLAVHAVLRAGGAYVPLDPDYPAERLAWMAADACAGVIITRRALAERISGADAVLVLMDEPWGDGPVCGTRPGDAGAAYMIYTSGSTGRPKGAVNTHGAIRNRLLWMQEAFPLGPRDVVLLKTPFSFDVSVWELFWPLMFGARLVVAGPGDHRDPARLAAIIRSQGVTVAHFVPSMLRAFLGTPGAAGCGSLRRVICSGEALPADLASEFLSLFRCDLQNLYGPTEAAVDVTHHACTAGEAPVPIGRPIANLEIAILDAGMRPVPRGVAGEILIGGAGLGRGYHGRPDLTAERWVPHPRDPGQRLYRTGDLGRWRGDGVIEYLGRSDFQVKIRGQRVELGEIESVLRLHGSVRDAAVIVQDARLTACVVWRSEAVPFEGLRQWLSARLPEHMVPGAWTELGAIPATASGKVDRRALAFVRASGAHRGFSPPRGEREELLAGAWSEVLGVSKVGRDDGYFALGGDSILSIHLQARLRTQGWDFDLADVFRNPTLSALAAALRPARGRAAGPASYSGLRSADMSRLPPGLEDAYPLTALQAGMVSHAELNPGSRAYHEVFSYEFRALWSEQALLAAVSQVARRHPVLRTSFALSGYSEPLQLVHALAPVPLAFSDLRGVARAPQDQAVSAWIESDLERGFDWSRAPLWRAHAHRRTESTWQFTLSAHHAILDGWSFATLLAELLETYLGLASGAAAPERAESAHFARYVALERAALADAGSRAFWFGALADAAVAPLARRGGRPAPAGTGQASARRSWRGGELAALGELAARAGVSLKHVLLAAHMKVAAVFSAQTDVVTGVITNGRPEEQGADQALGLFLNTMPLRVRLGGGSWLDLVRDVFLAEEHAWPHRRFPLAEIQKGQGRHALFDTTFNFVHYHGLSGLSSRGDVELLGARYFDENSFPYFAQFSKEASGRELSLELRYDPGHFLEAQAEDFADAYRAALAAMVAEPEAAHAATELVSRAEIGLVGRLCESGPLPPGAPRLLHEGFQANAARRPDAVAIVDGNRRVTYGELAGRVHSWAARLRELGAGPERLVGVCLERGADLITALLAVLESGSAYVPLDPAYPPERLAFICSDASVCALISRPGLAGRLPAGPWPLVDASGLSAQRPAAQPPRCAAEPANLAYLIYTSGSSGRPKAAAIEHRSACAMVAWALAQYPPSELAGTLAATSVCFDLSVFEIFVTLSSGGMLIVAENPLALAGLPAREEVTLLNTVPSAGAELVRQRAIPKGVRVVNLAGEPLPASLADQIYDLGVEKVYDLYGPSEDTTYSTWALRSRGGPETIGRVLPGSRLHLLDRDLQRVPLGAVGEIFIGGAGLARGYLGRPDLTAAAFVPDPFSGQSGARLYRTGDLARLREDGQLEFLGRADHQVKIRGFRIELGEIQAVLESNPRVVEAAVVARNEGGGRKSIAAYVTAQGAAEVGADELRRWVIERLPEPYVPSAFVILARLPRTPNGKLDRAALPSPGSVGGAAPRVVEAPRTAAERVIASVWSEVLRVPEVGANDNYFSLGGDSILALQVASRAREAGLIVTPRMLFEHPTVSALAAAAQGRAAPDAGRAPAVPADEGDLTPIQRWFFAQGFTDPHHWNQSVLLRARRPLDAGGLERAFAFVGSLHSELGRRFSTGAEGRWSGRTGDGKVFRFRHVRLEEAGAGLTEVCAAEQASLDLARGPLAGALWITGAGAGAGRLFMVIHHLAVDGVSWRILLDELWAAYTAFSSGVEPVRPPASAEPHAWARWLTGFARGGGLSGESAHWSPLAALAPEPLPRDLNGGSNLAGSAAMVALALEPTETESLLRRVLAAHGCQMNDILLTALALALRDWTGREAHVVNLEGHGREAMESGMDLGRSVGWFTSLYPVRLDLRGAAGAVRALDVVRAQLARVPRRGIGYGAGRYLAEPPLWGPVAAEVCLNYLGQFDGVVGPEAPFAPADEAVGPHCSPRGHRTHLVDANAMIVSGALRLEWHYPSAILSRATAEALAGRHLSHLRALIASAPAGRAPQDAELDRAIAELGL